MTTALMTYQGFSVLPDVRTAVFPANGRDKEIRVRLSDSPARYPVLMFFYHSMDPSDRPSLQDVRARHPFLDELMDLHDEMPCGWWTQNLREICRALRFDHNAMAPRFPGNVQKLGHRVVRHANLYFERELRKGHADRYAAQWFSTYVIDFLQSGKAAYLSKAASLQTGLSLDSAIRHCKQVNDMLWEAGFDRVARHSIWEKKA